MPNRLRVGVVGVGHVGSRHAQIYAAMPGVKLTAICDTDPARTRGLARTLGCRAFTDYHALTGLVDAVSLAVPTTLHAAIGQELLSRGIHVLIEKPIATTLPEADRLIRTAAKHRVVLQIGHVERFNAAIHTALDRLTHPRFIEVHRLSPYPFRGTDVSVVLDVMIHDLDLIQALVRSPLTRVAALGVPVLSRSEDIANARLEFASGCVANLTASRISDETIRRIRVFQEDSYLSIDYKAQTVELAQKRGRTIHRVQLPVNQRPPLQAELTSFVRSIATKRPPLVSGADGRAALALALRIERTMRQRKR
ncbi:MAG: Gfo/Idh/MocA family oxidoreductase [Candidatus Omnitrophota bacterium]|nr:Gfo/Idh/MocA family oxidoreductase [Candidatus Omnitrophota bacterium]